MATPAATNVIASTVVQPETLLGRAAAAEAAIKGQAVQAGNGRSAKPPSR